MVRMLQSTWAALLLGVLSYIGVTVLCWPKMSLSHAASKTEAMENVPNIDASWNYHNTELDELVAELKKEKEAVAIREQQLNDLALRLQNERTELNQITQKVFQMQRDFDTNIVRVREEEVPNLKRLVKVYSSMTPEAAAAVFKEMDDQQVVKILSLMKETETGPILEVLVKGGEADIKRAAAISEQMRLAISRAAPTKTRAQ